MFYAHKYGLSNNDNFLIEKKEQKLLDKDIDWLREFE
jgi:hypothetical protein